MSGPWWRGRLQMSCSSCDGQSGKRAGPRGANRRSTRVFLTLGRLRQASEDMRAYHSSGQRSPPASCLLQERRSSTAANELASERGQESSESPFPPRSRWGCVFQTLPRAEGVWPRGGRLKSDGGHDASGECEPLMSRRRAQTGQRRGRAAGRGPAVARRPPTPC